MKKIAIVLIAMVSFAFAANAQQDNARVPGDPDNLVFVSVSDDSKTSTSITFYNNSTKPLTVYVSIYINRTFEIGSGRFDVPAASEQGYHSEKKGYTISKSKICSNVNCDVDRIKITKVEVKK